MSAYEITHDGDGMAQLQPQLVRLGDRCMNLYTRVEHVVSAYPVGRGSNEPIAKEAQKTVDLTGELVCGISSSCGAALGNVQAGRVSNHNRRQNLVEASNAERAGGSRGT